MIGKRVQEHPAILAEDGPSANGDPMGTPAQSERVVWKGRPELLPLARTAFHTRSFAIYFIGLIAIAVILENTASALFLAGLAIAGLALLHLFAWQSARSTLYILTDARLILRIGMAIETRVNIPLKHIKSADLNMRGKDVGDIAVDLKGDRLLGYLLLWPHLRPFHVARPQPMLRAVADPKGVARLLAEVCAAHNAIQPNLIELKDAASPPLKPAREPALALSAGVMSPPVREDSLKGAPA